MAVAITQLVARSESECADGPRLGLIAGLLAVAVGLMLAPAVIGGLVLAGMVG